MNQYLSTIEESKESHKLDGIGTFLVPLQSILQTQKQTQEEAGSRLLLIYLRLDITMWSFVVELLLCRVSILLWGIFMQCLAYGCHLCAARQYKCNILFEAQKSFN